MGSRQDSSTLCCWLEEAHVQNSSGVGHGSVLPRMLSSASLSTPAVSGQEVVVEDIDRAVPAPSSASWLIGVFWSVFLLCSSAQRLWREPFLSASSAHFFLCSRHSLFCSSRYGLCFSWWLCLHPISVLFVHQTGKTISQEGLPNQVVMLEGCWGPARSSLDTAPKVVFFLNPCYTHHSTL